MPNYWLKISNMLDFVIILRVKQDSSNWKCVCDLEMASKTIQCEVAKTTINQPNMHVVGLREETGVTGKKYAQPWGEHAKYEEKIPRWTEFCGKSEAQRIKRYQFEQVFSAYFWSLIMSYSTEGWGRQAAPDHPPTCCILLQGISSS